MNCGNECTGLIGHTGFVGSNILSQTMVHKTYHRENLSTLEGQRFDRLYCAGIPAVKWWANQNPEADWENIKTLIDTLKTVSAKQFVLISTVDVYANPIDMDELTPIDPLELAPYGKHRYQFEQFAHEKNQTGDFESILIVRLPGLFGPGLKKNIIFDFLTQNRLEFIECRSVFQFYNLERLTSDIQTALDAQVSMINFATEPVSVAEVAQQSFDMAFINTLEQPPARYDMKTRYAHLYQPSDSLPYLMDKLKVLDEIRAFVAKSQAKEGAIHAN